MHRVGRGGQLTYHGPGQRILYAVIDLKSRAPDVRRYVATLEEVIIRTLAAFNVCGERRADRIGVWVRRPDKGEGHEDNIAAILRSTSILTSRTLRASCHAAYPTRALVSRA